jgi:catechol 2,3-dioxygenase-like lactoylglutathione lyase family enzyme
MQKLTHIGIQVSDLATSERFYHDTLRCRKTGKIEDEKVSIAFMGYANGTIELVQQLDSGTGAVLHGPFAHLAFEVDDINDEYERIKALGVKMIDEAPREFSHGKLFFFKGPDGESIEFCSGIRIDPV